MKKALVTGASGFTGGYLCQALKERGYAVKALVRKNSNRALLEKLDIKLIDGDLSEPASLRGKIKSIDTVFHLASLYRQQGITKDMFTKVNVEGTRVMLEESIAGGVKRFVHCSTVGVQGVLSNPPVTENAPYNPFTPYQESRMKAEKLVLSYSQKGRIGSVVVRPVCIYGPGSKRFLELFKDIYKRNFRMIGKGNALCHLTYVEDLVSGIILAAESPAAPGQIYTLAGNEYLPFRELVKIVAELFNKPVPKLHIPLWSVRIAAFLSDLFSRSPQIEPTHARKLLNLFTMDKAFDISKARKELNYNPITTLREGLTRTAIWYKENGWLQ
ncbi:MAG TPA: NAD-dependent epimerase/dehydratase family protein [Candidatus Deferrimicrobium sp.]|nr:NAD-dependent epimerase/dehydratase family protein [Candidatus Kapabacteria bacterium]HLP57722.1 NAD-dependent epimerase/dehydratase family protein [Candidatus Deferrimicrobium sp.]